MASPWWTGTAGIGGATRSLQKQMKMKEEPSETMLADEVLMTKSTPWLGCSTGDTAGLISDTTPVTCHTTPVHTLFPQVQVTPAGFIYKPWC